MHAITAVESGGPEVLRWEEVPDPEPGPGEVLMDITASAVNRADIGQRRGGYVPPAGSSPYPGLECSGVIATTGEPVCALLTGGGYAEKVAVPAAQVLPIPAGVAIEDAAALPEVACTVWSNVVQIAGLTKGETLLVHGGGSGIGTFAIQLGKALGAYVVTTARPHKHEALKQLGADVTLDYLTGDWSRGVVADVVLDIVGGPYLDHNIAVLTTNGRLAVIGTQGGQRAELDLGALMLKRGRISATTLRRRSPDEKAEIVRGVREQVWPLIAEGRIRPVIDRRLPMAEAATAHRHVESGEHVGKVLLVNGPIAAEPAVDHG